MYICTVIQLGTVVHQQSTERLAQIDKWIKVFRTDKVTTIREGYWELVNDSGTRKMLVTW